MKKQNREQVKMRMIHVRLPDEVHKSLRVLVAEKDVTIQDWVREIIERELAKKNAK